jgi:hypothetical protein
MLVQRFLVDPAIAPRCRVNTNNRSREQVPHDIPSFAVWMFDREAVYVCEEHDQVCYKTVGTPENEKDVTQIRLAEIESQDDAWITRNLHAVLKFMINGLQRFLPVTATSDGVIVEKGRQAT